MFRLFLINLLKSGKDLEEATERPKNVLPPRRLRNRRIYERFDIDHKHLSLMNDQDILLVRDLSEKGFSTEVSERGFRRFVVGDVYRCRIRYLGEVYEAEVCVRWKTKGFVGFELFKASRHMRHFMKRLIDPLEIGTSLQKVDEKFHHGHDNEGMIWYHGPKETNFYLWHDEAGTIKSWKLENRRRFIKWEFGAGICTGSLQASADDPPQLLRPWDPHKVIEDHEPNLEMKQFAADIFMALQIPIKEQLIESIIG